MVSENEGYGWRFWLFAALGFLVFAYVGYQWNSRGGSAVATVSAASSGTTSEVNLVYVGSSTCGSSNVGELVAWLKEIEDRIARRAEGAGYAFTTTGIAKDRVVANGLAHLQKYQPFDQIATGRGWMGMGSLKYVFGDLPGPGATPQIVVVRQNARRPPDGPYAMKEEDVIVRKIGLREIEAWVEMGAPIPDLPPVSADGAADTT